MPSTPASISSQESFDRQLGQLLLSRGALRPSDLEEALTEQMIAGGGLGLNLWELGLMGIESLTRAGADVVRLPAVDYAAALRTPRAALTKLDADFARDAALCPIAIEGRKLTVATARPWRLDLIDAAGFRSGLAIRPSFACDIAVHRLLYRLYGIPAARRYRANPVPRVPSKSRSSATAVPVVVEESFGELTSQEEFLALYASDPASRAAQPIVPESLPADSPLDHEPAERAARQSLAEAGSARPSSRRDPQDVGDVEELVLSDWIQDPVVPPPSTSGALEPIATAELALQALEAAQDRAALAEVLVRFGLSVAARAALFVCRAQTWIGWSGGGGGLTPARVAGVMVPVIDGTVFSLVHGSGAPFLGPLPAHAVHRAFRVALESREGASVGLFPVRHRGRVTFLIYLEASPGRGLDVGEVLLLAQRVPATLERIVASRRAEQERASEARSEAKPSVAG